MVDHKLIEKLNIVYSRGNCIERKGPSIFNIYISQINQETPNGNQRHLLAVNMTNRKWRQCMHEVALIINALCLDK